MLEITSSFLLRNKSSPGCSGQDGVDSSLHIPHLAVKCAEIPNRDYISLYGKTVR